MDKSKKDLLNQEDEWTVTLTLDDDSTLECAVLTIFNAAAKEYIALVPLKDGDMPDDAEVFLYRFEEENGEPVLGNIEDDDEYDRAADAFEEWQDTMAFEDLAGEGSGEAH